MQPDPVMLMADTFVRIVTVDLAHAIVWIPLIAGVAWLHARWLRRER